MRALLKNIILLGLAVVHLFVNSLTTCFHLRANISKGTRAGFYTGIRRRINRSICPTGTLRTTHMEVYGTSCHVQEKNNREFFCKVSHCWDFLRIMESKGCKKWHLRQRHQHCCQRPGWEPKSVFRSKSAPQYMPDSHTFTHIANQ